MAESLEKRFYLEAFRGRAFVIHLGSPYRPDDIARVLSELRSNDTRAVVVCARAGGSQAALSLPAGSVGAAEKDLARLGGALLREGLAEVALPRAAGPLRRLRASVTLALRFGASKLVVVDPRGGLSLGDRRKSFVTAAQLRRLVETEGARPWTRQELAWLLAAIEGGVESINLTTAEGLADELFTYEGSGTLVTPTAYCRVAPLRLDDFEQAAALLRRGEREGFLLERSDEERARLLLAGYGAWFAGRRLAGVAALDRTSYRREGVAEIAGLYTITRFQGGGVGVRLVQALLREARREGLSAVFACTSNARAAAFFGRMGFVEASPAAVPARKWHGRRGPLPRVFVRKLARRTQAAG
ncbi:MAG: GNAT family N-acetyltransferase [Candidatus Dadabacteria bacterium]|nr:MAG: GNAT family N-acetyltransferase [Candidatus Dadabacteria bacterium]